MLKPFLSQHAGAHLEQQAVLLGSKTNVRTGCYTQSQSTTLKVQSFFNLSKNELL